jgi:hypothetical protein
MERNTCRESYWVLMNSASFNGLWSVKIWRVKGNNITASWSWRFLHCRRLYVSSLSTVAKSFPFFVTISINHSWTLCQLTIFPRSFTSKDSIHYTVLYCATDTRYSLTPAFVHTSGTRASAHSHRTRE